MRAAIDACRPVLDSARILTSDVNWDEFHALLFVPCSLLTELAETSMKRRCVSFWSDCDEVIQECLNNVLEAEDSEDLPLRVEFRSKSRMRCAGACLNSVP